MEHKHEWDIYTNFDDVIRARCDCGEDRDVYGVLGEQAQRLAVATALLHDAVTHMMLTRTTDAQVYLEIRTFLAKGAE